MLETWHASFVLASALMVKRDSARIETHRGGDQLELSTFWWYEMATYQKPAKQASIAAANCRTPEDVPNPSGKVNMRGFSIAHPGQNRNSSTKKEDS
jgi:hypothetical protein